MFLRIADFYKKYRTECNIYFLALSVQLIIFLLLVLRFKGFLPFEFLIYADSDEYIKLGINFFTHHIFSVISDGGYFFPEAVRPPLYPLFIAFFYAIEKSLWLGVMVQNIVAATIPVIVYKIGMLFWKNKKIAVLGAVIFLFEPERIVMSNQLLSDSFFIFFILLSFYFYAVLEKDISKKKYVVIFGVFAALATLTRPIGIIMAAGYPIFLLLRGIWDHLWKKRLISIFIFMAVFFAVCFPWMLRNYKVFGQFRVSVSGNYTFYLENIPFYYQHKYGLRGPKSDEVRVWSILKEKFLNDNGIPRDTDDTVLVRGIMRDFKYDDYYWMQFSEILKNDPWGYASAHLYRLIPYFSETKYSLIFTKLFGLPSAWGYPYIFFGSRIPWILIEMFSLACFFAEIEKKRLIDWRILFSVFLIGAFAVVSAMNGAVSRLRQPVNGLIFLLFAYYLWQLKITDGKHKIMG